MITSWNCGEMRYEVEGERERESEMTHRQSRWVEVDRGVHSVLSLPCAHVPSVLVGPLRNNEKKLYTQTQCERLIILVYTRVDLVKP